MPSTKAKLIYEWATEDKARYRLVALARWTSGYEDEYILECAQTDALGDTRWVKYDQWDKSTTGNTSMILTEGFKTALAALSTRTP